ncbi:Uncharacterized protein TPAR_01210 [Tolypocladium paradoxum]|uniref:Uncharacterized protein n=1 Tax=Tolypocladium paradoxum TaxID=94208 RepID=A0A2S4L824_9HYPO|nr:Uncharacterized protein TPAR_01210 [Tolypocladium paradoxum]
MGESKTSSKASARHDEHAGKATARIRSWPRIVLYCIAGILMYGYDNVVVGTTSAMPSFQRRVTASASHGSQQRRNKRDFGELLNSKQIVPSYWLGIWTFAQPGRVDLWRVLRRAVPGLAWPARFVRPRSLHLHRRSGDGPAQRPRPLRTVVVISHVDRDKFNKVNEL